MKGYPDGHPDGLAEDDELTNLKAKVDAGANFIITQLFYDSETFAVWVKKVRQRGERDCITYIYFKFG